MKKGSILKMVKKNRKAKNLEVSVVIPVYNGEETLRQCLNSVLNQTYKNYEVIVVDNNSSDRSKEIIKEFQRKNKRVRYAFEKIRIRGAARNTGVKHAKGKIILCTDSDCIVPRYWIQKLIKPISSMKEAAAQGFEKPAYLNFWTKQNQIKSKNFFKNVKSRGYVSCVDTKNFAILKKVLIQIGNFNRTIHAGEDIEILLRLLKRGFRIKYVGIQVKHFHRTTFLGVIKTEFERGFWITKIKKRYPNDNHPFFEANNLSNFLKFVPGLLYLFLKRRYSFPQSLFEFITGISWRAGIIWALIKRNY